MMGSLQDQLIKAGLADESQAKKTTKSRKRKPNKAKTKPQTKAQTGSKKGAASKGGKGMSLAAAYAARAKSDKDQKVLSGKRKQMEDERRRKVNLQLKEIILPAAKNNPEAEIERYLEFKGKIRKLYVTSEQQDALNDGDLGIVYLQGRHYIVEPELVEQVRAIQADNVSLDPKDVTSKEKP